MKEGIDAIEALLVGTEMAIDAVAVAVAATVASETIAGVTGVTGRLGLKRSRDAIAKTASILNQKSLLVET